MTNKNNAKRNRRWIAGYAFVIVLGAFFGWGASPKPSDPKDIQKETVKNVLRAIERISEDATTQETDGGVPEKEANAEPPARAFAPSPEPTAEADAGLPEYRRLPAKVGDDGKGRRVVIVEVHDVIDMGLSAHIERAVKNNPDAAALILDINTPGGRVDAATLIRDAVINAPKTMRTVAFIHPRAISAGAFISFACDLIFIADGGTMGAATPISIGSGGEAVPVEEKMVSYFRTEMASTARAKGRRGDIAEAMVDAEVEIKGISPAGKLLTLDTAGALRYKIADAKANNMEEVLSLLALRAADKLQAKMNWAEKLARILTDPMLSGILMSIGVLGILIELYHPGFGLPGVVGITCLLIFFAGHLVVNLAGWEESLLFLAGLILIVIEVFVTPGFGVLGIAGITSVVISLVLAMTSLPIDVSFSTGNLASSLVRVVLSMGASIVLFFVAMALLPKSAIKSRLILDAAIVETASGGPEGEALQSILASGMQGTAESFLRPAGIARFGDKRVDVTSEGDFIESGTPVVIVRVSGNHATVRKIS
jgi:membrane-bound serine protease (ClpP class)